jgi:hypothetical protein
VSLFRGRSLRRLTLHDAIGDCWYAGRSEFIHAWVCSSLTFAQHSSVPPTHTGIGIMSQIVKSIEDHPFQPTVCAVSVDVLVTHAYLLTSYRKRHLTLACSLVAPNTHRRSPSPTRRCSRARRSGTDSRRLGLKNPLRNGRCCRLLRRSM